MFIPFDDMLSQSRVWVYQSSRQMTEDEQLKMSAVAQAFIQQWAAHNQPLKGSFKFFYNHFLVVSVDESYHQASGCSIDASVHLVKQIEQQFKIDFFDRTKVAFLNEGEVFLESISDLKTKVLEGKIKDHTLTFNNLVKDKEELTTQWMVPASESWLKRYFPKVEQH